MKSITRKAISGVLILCLAAPVLPARAELVGAQATDRERIAAVMARDDVRAHLVSRGVDVAQAEARLAALTDAEAAQLAKDIDALPAGGNPVAALAAAAAVVVYVIAAALTLVVMGAVAVVKRARADAAKERSAQ